MIKPKKVVFGPKRKIASFKPTEYDCFIVFNDPGKREFATSFESSKVFINECNAVQFSSEGKVFTEEMGTAQAEFLKKHLEAHPDCTIFVCCENGEMRSASCALSLSDFFEVSLYNQDILVSIDNRHAPVTRIYDFTYIGLELTY